MGTKNNPGAFDCYAALGLDEPHFVLRATDPQAPALLRKWATDRENSLDAPTLYVGDRDDEGRWVQPNAERVKKQKAKIAEARYCAAQMEVWRHENQEGE